MTSRCNGADGTGNRCYLDLGHVNSCVFSLATPTTIDAALLTEALKPADPVKPRHYKDLNPEPIDVIAAWRLNFNLGNAVKYIARADLKGTPITDLRKAAAYLAHEIALREKTHDGKPGVP